MRLTNEEKERIIRFFEDELDPADFTQKISVFLHEALTLQFAAQEIDSVFCISPKTMAEGYYYLTMLFGHLDPQSNIHNPAR